MRGLKKYLGLILIMLLSVINIKAASVYANYSKAVKNTDTYITKFNRYKLFIDTTNKYLYNGSTLEVKTGFNEGGFLNTYEFNASMDANKDSYLITGSRYFTMTETGNNVDTIDVRKISTISKDNSLESRISELIIPETRVTGNGSRSNPWMFIIPEFKVTIKLINAKISGKDTIEEIVIGYNKTYTITPDQSYYIFKGKTGDLVCDSTVGNYKVVDNKLVLENLKGDATCSVRYRGMDVAANIVVNNGTAASSKITGEAGDDLSTTITPTKGYAYDSVSCTNSQNGTYVPKTITVKKIIKDTTCTVTYGKPSNKTFTFVASNQTYNVQYSGYYTITGYGAQGENSGGKGSKATGTIYLNKGDTLTINTGGAGSNTGTAKGYNGGGTGQYYGGGSSTVKKNGTILLAAAGGGGGTSGTAGGNGSGKGGASVGGNAGTNGTNGGGGGSSYDYHYEVNCSSCYYGENTCRGGYEDYNCSSCYTQTRVCQGGYESYTYGGGGGSVCTTCHNGKYGSSYDSTENVNCGSDRKVWSCGSWPACGNSGSVCKSCSGYCVGERYDPCASYDYECEYGCDRRYDACLTGHNTCSYGCDQRTNSYKPGYGGTNIFNSGMKNTSESYGSRTSNGEVTISFHGEEL